MSDSLVENIAMEDNDYEQDMPGPNSQLETTGSKKQSRFRKRVCIDQAIKSKESKEQYDLDVYEEAIFSLRVSISFKGNTNSVVHRFQTYG